MFRFEAAHHLMTRRPDEALLSLNEAIKQGQAALDEGRNAIQELKSGLQLTARIQSPLSGTNGARTNAPSAFVLSLDDTSTHNKQLQPLIPQKATSSTRLRWQHNATIYRCG
jgi:hypothetical protein